MEINMADKRTTLQKHEFFTEETIDKIMECLDKGFVHKTKDGIMFEIGADKKGVITARHRRANELAGELVITAEIFPEFTPADYYFTTDRHGNVYHFDSNAEFVIFLRHWTGYEY